MIPFFCVDAVCEVPFGSYPGNMPYEYFSDEEHLRRWLEVERDEKAVRKLPGRVHLRRARTSPSICEQCGGLPRMQELRRQEFLLDRGTLIECQEGLIACDRATYNAMELMICCAARALEDGRTVAVGTGVPCAAAMLAQRTHAPNLVIFFEAGGVAPQLPTMPISVGDSRTFYRGARWPPAWPTSWRPASAA